MRVLEDSLSLARPDDNRVVRPARSEVLTVLGVVDGVNLGARGGGKRVQTAPSERWEFL